MIFQYDEPVYRPPSEGSSLILQATVGCSHNRCTFCLMYKQKRFWVKPWDQFKSEIDEASLLFPGTKRIFLADGDAFVISSERLGQILDYLYSSFPSLQRVTAYANPANLLNKSVEEMRTIKEKGLKIIYYGVETGDPRLLELIDKGATPDQMAEGCNKAQEAGLKISVTVILGLGGRRGSRQHARLTGQLINRISPRYLSALTLMLGQYQEGFRKKMGADFEFNRPEDDLKELKELIAALENDRCIFRSNHASNYLPLKGTLQKDKEALIDTIDNALNDPEGYLRKEWMRGL
ncbi:MAG: radical SAM protein [Candidatus Krumholzibacteriota bacterium]|nr:radical SAM protein [Candidatus Krumholzibacteriota bacterium]